MPEVSIDLSIENLTKEGEGFKDRVDITHKMVAEKSESKLRYLVKHEIQFDEVQVKKDFHLHTKDLKEYEKVGFIPKSTLK